MMTTADRPKRSDLPPEALSLPLPQRIGWLDSREACDCMTKAARKRIRRQLKGQIAVSVRIATGQQSVGEDGRHQGSHLATGDGQPITVEGLAVVLLARTPSAFWSRHVAEYIAWRGLATYSLVDSARAVWGSGVYPPPVNYRWNRWCRCDDCERQAPRVSSGNPLFRRWRRGEKRGKGQERQLCVDCHAASYGVHKHRAERDGVVASEFAPGEFTTESPSAASIQALDRRTQDGRPARLEQAQLASDNTSTLLAEIRHFEATGTIAGSAKD